MQFTHAFDGTGVVPVGWGVPLLLVQGPGDGALVQKLLRLGGQVALRAGLRAARFALAEAPGRFGLVVVDCDSLGRRGLPERVAGALRGAAVPVVLISRAHQQQEFPQDLAAPVRLRAPVSPVGLRVGVEHALRGRLAGARG